MDHSRQQGIFDPKKFTWPMNMIGLGGIGGAGILVFAKLGITNFRLWDPDILEDPNIPTQLIYRERDIGKTKVAAAGEIIASLGREYSVTGQERLFTDADGATLKGITVSGVHTMGARSQIWEGLKFNFEVPLYLDGRLGGEILELFTIEPSGIEDVEIYEQFLFSDDEIEPLPCTERAIIHPAVILAGLMASQLTRWFRKEAYYRRIMLDLRNMNLIQQFKTRG